MIELNFSEKVLTITVQAVLYLLCPWQTQSRGDVILLLVALGVCAVVIVAVAEWAVEHVLKIELPG